MKTKNERRREYAIALLPHVRQDLHRELTTGVLKKPELGFDKTAAHITFDLADVMMAVEDERYPE